MSEKLYREFINYSRQIEDPRQPIKLTYPLDEILFLVLCGTISGCEGWDEISFFGEEHIKFLRGYLKYESGIPSSTTILRVLSMIKSDIFEEFFGEWFCKFNSGNIISIDGKTIRGSKRGGKKALHILHALDAESAVLLGYKHVDGKTNEIPVSKEMIEELDINGKIITLDAMGAQREICESIISNGGDYVIGLKGNQGNLHEDVKFLFKERAEIQISEKYDIDKCHGRIEERTLYATEDLGYLLEEHKWPGLRSLVMCEYKHKDGKKKVQKEKLYYISSLEASVESLAKCIRSHWSVESFHWILDVTFKEDKISISVDNAASNLSSIRRMAANMLKIYQKHTDSPSSIKRLQKTCFLRPTLIKDILDLCIT
jgi:predicted transposase YbfD/YdcC